MDNSKAFIGVMTEAILSEIAGTFPNARKRLRIVAETEKYRVGEDESVWKQAKGMSAPVAEAYFDGEFVAFLNADEGEAKAKLAFLNGFLKLYKANKLYVNEDMYAILEAKEEERIRKAQTVEIAKATTPEEKQVQAALIAQAKKKKKKVKIV